MVIQCIDHQKDKSFISKTEMGEQIISLLGGKVAEEIVIKISQQVQVMILKEQQQLQNQ